MSDKFVLSDGFFGRVKPAEYHAAKHDGVASKSDLSAFWACPIRWRMDRDAGNKGTSSPAMDWGSLVDCLLLTPELFEATYLICDETRRSTTKGKANHALAEEQGLTVVTHADVEEAQKAVEVMQTFLAIKGIEVGRNAHTQIGMCIHSERYNILLCGMLDIVPHDGLALADLKTTSCDLSDERKLRNLITDMKYHWQAWLYLDLYNNLRPDDERSGFDFYFQESKPPYVCRKVSLTASEIERGGVEVNAALDALARCRESGRYPGLYLSDLEGGLWGNNIPY